MTVLRLDCGGDVPAGLDERPGHGLWVLTRPRARVPVDLARRQRVG
jgi:hypothetical protein